MGTILLRLELLRGAGAHEPHGALVQGNHIRARKVAPENNKRRTNTSIYQCPLTVGLSAPSKQSPIEYLK